MKRVHVFIALIVISTKLIMAQDWSIQIVTDEGVKPDFVLDAFDRAHIAVINESGSGWVKYFLIDQNGKSESIVSEGYFYGPPSIAVNIDGNPFIAYHDHRIEDQVVMNLNNGEWLSNPTPSSGHDGWDNSILVDENGRVHTSSIDPSGFGGSGVEYGFYNDGNWMVESTGSGPVDYANGTSIAINKDNEIFISYYHDGDQVLKMASRLSGSWINEIVDDGTDTGRFSSILASDDGKIYISYYQGNGAVKLAVKENNEWSHYIIDQLGNVAIGFTGARNLTSIAKFGNRIGISYSDRDRVKFAVWENSILTKETIMTADDSNFGQITSLDFDEQGKPHVVFSDLPNGSEVGHIYYATREQTVPNKDVLLHQHQIIISPNPSRIGMHLEIQTELENIAEIRIFDMTGRSIYHTKDIKDNLLLPPFEQAGLYLVVMKSNEHAFFIQKLIAVE